MTTVPLEQQVEVETPEQVVFSYTVAGVGSRAAAAVIDHLLIAAAIITIFFLLSFVAGALTPGSGRAAEFVSSWITALMILLSFGVMWGYYVLFEALWDGQTPGKRRMGIRVVQDGGYSVSFAASAARNLARIVDIQPFPSYAVGILSAAVTRSGKRVGDFLAGTFVVQERMVHVSPAGATTVGAVAEAPVVTARLTEEEYALLERFLARRGTLDAQRRQLIAHQLADRFGAHLAVDDGAPLARLLRLYDSERDARARGIAARGAKGAAREQHAIVAQGATRWSDFARVLAEAQRRGLRSMSEREVSEFVARYRELATDLARLKTAAAGRDLDAVFYVSRLVGAGHNLLYRRQSISLASAWRYVSLTVPRELRRSGAYIALAAVLLFGPAIISYTAVVRNPALAEELLPPGMIDRATEGLARDKRGVRYYVDVKDFERPIMASSIIANNVQVTYGAFALGITLGLGTALLLLFNGVSIGSAVGLYASKGIIYQIRDFVIAHGVLELTAICVAAGGGFLIASALLVPGAMTRQEALVVRGRRAIRLVTASTLMLIGAGTIEGLVSPRQDVPVMLKYAVSAATALLIIFYFTRGRGLARPGAEDA